MEGSGTPEPTSSLLAARYAGDRAQPRSPDPPPASTGARAGSCTAVARCGLRRRTNRNTPCLFRQPDPNTQERQGPIRGACSSPRIDPARLPRHEASAVPQARLAGGSGTDLLLRVGGMSRRAEHQSILAAGSPEGSETRCPAAPSARCAAHVRLGRARFGQERGLGRGAARAPQPESHALDLRALHARRRDGPFIPRLRGTRRHPRGTGE